MQAQPVFLCRSLRVPVVTLCLQPGCDLRSLPSCFLTPWQLKIPLALRGRLLPGRWLWEHPGACSPPAVQLQRRCQGLAVLRCPGVTSQHFPAPWGAASGPHRLLCSLVVELTLSREPFSHEIGCPGVGSGALVQKGGASLCFQHVLGQQLSVLKPWPRVQGRGARAMGDSVLDPVGCPLPFLPAFLGLCWPRAFTPALVLGWCLS